MHTLTAAAAMAIFAGTASAQLVNLFQRYRISPASESFNRYINFSGTIDTSGQISQFIIEFRANCRR